MAMTSMRTWKSDATAWLAAAVHDNLIEQLAKLRAAVLRAQENHPKDLRPTPTSSSSGTTRRRRSSCMPGSTTSRPCGRQAANPTPTPCSRRCWDAATRQTTGRLWWQRATPIKDVSAEIKRRDRSRRCGVCRQFEQSCMFGCTLGVCAFALAHVALRKVEVERVMGIEPTLYAWEAIW